MTVTIQQSNNKPGKKLEECKKNLCQNEPKKQESISTKLFFLHNAALNNGKPEQ